MEKDNNKLRRAAIWYAKMGWAVFPCHVVKDGKCTCGAACASPGKHPRTPKGFENASKDAGQIMRWWTQWPDANIGIATGAVSGLWVLDVDKDHGGYDTLDQLLKDYTPFNRTPESVTGSGGNHVVFKHPGYEVRNSQGKVGKGIDVRGDGGYIIAPPSIHPNGNQYMWDIALRPHETPLADAPEWLLDKLKQPAQPIQPVNSPVSQPAESLPTIPVSKNTLDFFANGAAVGQQRDRAVKAARNYMSAGHTLDETIEKIWQGLQLCEQEAGREKWTYQQAVYLVNNLHESTAPALPERDGWASKSARYNQGQMEFIVCAAAYLVPDMARVEMGWLQESHFTYYKTKAFWRLFIETGNRDHAAGESGILPRLLEILPGIEPHLLSEYARRLVANGYMTVISNKAEKLDYALATGDMDTTRRLIKEMDTQAPPVNGREMGTVASGIDKLDEVLENPLNIIKTFIPPIDRALKGLPLRFHSVWAARPGLGKTTLLWQIARNVARSKRRVSVFSEEMSETDLWGKAVCGMLGLDWYAVMAGEISAQQKVEFHRAKDQMKRELDGYLFIDDRPNSTDTIWQSVTQYQPELVIIDHLRLLKDKDDNVVQRLGRITSRLKEIAKLGNCHVASIHQINRAVEGRTDKEPNLSDLRDSGLIEEDVDLALMLYRDDYYDKQAKEEARVLTKLIVTKDRFRKGKNPRINLAFDVKHEYYDELDEIHPFTRNGSNGHHKQEREILEFAK